ncbi:DUF4271 domain-containing protein [Zunongwangia sp.]|uniref:DUF4271 domain-containing protein n=1 Tax=Zunongwangia sp. TaxID=1965325 RepID=UPI003AA8A654
MLQAIERHTEYLDWVTIVFLICFLLLVIVRQRFPKKFYNFASILTSNKFMLFRGKESNPFHGFNILLFIVNALSVSVLIYWILDFYNLIKADNYILNYVRIVTAYACFILIKFGVEKIISNIFDIDDAIDYYLFQKLAYRNYIALLILPITLLTVYSIKITESLVYIIFTVIIIANLTSFFNIFKKQQKLIINNWFYFILYLCALEIAPYFILYKLITVKY